METTQTSQQNQASFSFPSPEVIVKKKRGRPRKDPSQPPKSPYVPRKRSLALNFGQSAPIPPGFEGANGSQPQSVDPVIDNNKIDNNVDTMVGRVVTGVIEAVFDAGYLISVRVGDSNISLRGVVFKSGHYVPVSPENDLAPGLQMIRRNEVPFPVESQTQKRKHRGRKRTEHFDVSHSNGSYGSPASNQGAGVQGRQLAIVPVDPLEGRGKLVPVVLKPVILANGASPAVEVRPIASKPAHLSASRVKLGHATHVVPEVSQPFEELVSVAKKLKGVPNSAEIQNDSGKLFSKRASNDSGVAEEEGEDLSKPLCVEPLQAIHSRPMPHPFPERSTGKMTELLMAVQENLKERQMSETPHQEFGNPGK